MSEAESPIPRPPRRLAQEATLDPNLVRWQVAATGPKQPWGADITCVPAAVASSIPEIAPDVIGRVVLGQPPVSRLEDSGRRGLRDGHVARLESELLARRRFTPTRRQARCSFAPSSAVTIGTADASSAVNVHRRTSNSSTPSLRTRHESPTTSALLKPVNSESPCRPPSRLSAPVRSAACGDRMRSRTPTGRCRPRKCRTAGRPSR